MLGFFNVALFPKDANLACTCVDFAQTNFSIQASEYLLGSSALPHVTLCQFECTGGAEQLRTIWLAIESLQTMPIVLKFKNMYIKPGERMHEGKYWVGLSVEPTESLSALQKDVYEKLCDLGLEGKNSPSNYFPHLTFARCQNEKPPRFASMPAEEIWRNDYLFEVSLGHSDENGVYRERIYPA